MIDLKVRKETGQLLRREVVNFNRHRVVNLVRLVQQGIRQYDKARKCIHMKHLNIAMILATLNLTSMDGHGQGYPDGRHSPTLRLEAKDQGVVLRQGDGPGQCDYLGAREALIFEENGVYHLFYDGAGPKGWLACLELPLSPPKQ